MNVSQIHRMLRDAFRAAALPTPDLDARLLVEHLIGLSPVDLLRDPDAVVGEADRARLMDAKARRLAGEPVHRILGSRDFYGLRLTLSPETLEPRSDTETLVDAVMPFLNARCERFGAARLLDLGTGTGAIALALLKSEPRATALGSDISAGALATAARNAQINGVEERFAMVQSDWWRGIDGQFDLILSNPPYIATADIARLDPGVSCFDPLAALDGGADGLDAYRLIAKGAADHLAEDGLVAVEIGHDQGLSADAVFRHEGFAKLRLVKDLAGQDRVLLFQRQKVPI